MWKRGLIVSYDLVDFKSSLIVAREEIYFGNNFNTSSSHSSMIQIMLFEIAFWIQLCESDFPRMGEN